MNIASKQNEILNYQSKLHDIELLYLSKVNQAVTNGFNIPFSTKPAANGNIINEISEQLVSYYILDLVKDSQEYLYSLENTAWNNYKTSFSPLRRLEYCYTDKNIKLYQIANLFLEYFVMAHSGAIDKLFDGLYYLDILTKEVMNYDDKIPDLYKTLQPSNGINAVYSHELIILQHLAFVYGKNTYNTSASIFSGFDFKWFTINHISLKNRFSSVFDDITQLYKHIETVKIKYNVSCYIHVIDSLRVLHSSIMISRNSRARAVERLTRFSNNSNTTQRLAYFAGLSLIINETMRCSNMKALALCFMAADIRGIPRTDFLNYLEKVAK